VAQVVEHLLDNCEVLSSKGSWYCQKKKKKRKEKKKKKERIEKVKSNGNGFAELVIVLENLKHRLEGL
jgi:hypothetical protein